MDFKLRGSKSGSVLVYVLVIVVIAALIGTSYLAFVDNQRARTGRNLNQDSLRISTEQALLAMEAAIRSELLATGEVKLGALNRSEAVSGISLNISSRTAGDGSDFFEVQPFVNATDLSQFSSLSAEDLFGQARARVTLVDLDIRASSTVPNVRLPDLNINDHPQIAVREIPVSQFTVFSASGSFTVGSTVFGQDIGRVFSDSTVSINGNFSSDFTIVAGENVVFSDAKSALQIKDPSANNARVKLTTGTQDADFLPDARTKLDSRIVTGNVLPIDSAPLDSVYASGNGAHSASNGLNLSLLQAQCDLLVVARPDITITAPNGTKECLVTVVGNAGGRKLAYSSATNSAGHINAGNPGQQTVAFAAAQNIQNPSQTILTLDYARLGTAQISSIFLVVRDPAGSPVSNAVILIRGAQVLAGPLSIVTPHPIIIAGDFNVGDDTPAASIVTPANVQTVTADWGTDLFGNI